MDKRLERNVELLQAGDQSGFDAIYERTHKAVYFTILYLVKDKAYAEDLLQDTFVKAISSIGQYTLGTNFTGWLCTIGRSLALNHIKKYKREESADFSVDSNQYGSYEEETPFIFDLARQVLKEDEYEIVMLCNVAGYKRREVAEMLHIPIGTVTWKNNEGLKKLKQTLEKEEERHE